MRRCYASTCHSTQSDLTQKVETASGEDRIEIALCLKWNRSQAVSARNLAAWPIDNLLSGWFSCARPRRRHYDGESYFDTRDVLTRDAFDHDRECQADLFSGFRSYPPRDILFE